MNQPAEATIDVSVQPDAAAFFDEPTNTLSYVARDPVNKACARVDG